MAQKSKKQQLWLVKQDTDNTPDRNCVVLTWQLVNNGQKISYMAYFNDIDIYVESSSLPEINRKGMENIFDWGVPIKHYNLHQTTSQKVEYSKNISKKIQDEFQSKIIEEGMDYLTDNGWETANFSVKIFAPFFINKIDGIVGINNEQMDRESILNDTEAQEKEVASPINYIENKLNEIITDNMASLKSGNFQVRPGYAYDKFFLDKIEESYDESLQGLIHHIMFEDGIYKKILSKAQFSECASVAENTPEYIYSPSGDNKNDDSVQQTLDDIYWDSLSFVANKFDELGIDNSAFADYL